MTTVERQVGLDQQEIDLLELGRGDFLDIFTAEESYMFIVEERAVEYSGAKPLRGTLLVLNKGGALKETYKGAFLNGYYSDASHSTIVLDCVREGFPISFAVQKDGERVPLVTPPVARFLLALSKRPR